MEEKSFQDKKGIINNSTAHRLSESRPIFKPVLVKTLLADESDDDSDDQMQSSDNSEEEFDDFDSCQPLPDECVEDSSKTLRIKGDVKVDIAIKDETVFSNPSSCVKIAEVNEQVNQNIEIPQASGSSISCTEKTITEQKSVLNTYLKDSLKISDYSAKTSEENNLSLDKAINGAKRKSSAVEQERSTTTIQPQWQSNFSQDNRQSSLLKDQSHKTEKPNYSPEIKRHSSVLNEVKDRPGHTYDSYPSFKNYQESRYSLSSHSKSHSIPRSLNYEVKDEKLEEPMKVPIDHLSNTKTSSSHSAVNVSHAVMDTPMKQPQNSSRPNPCLSHRNIFQTPQNKVDSDFIKNSMQTPATIFSHWSQQHMAQTPMNNQLSSTRESGHTPGTSIAQLQSSRRETPRYFTGEGKSVRRPLAETMYSGPVHGSQLSRLQELPNELQPRQSVSRDCNIAMQENLADKKLVCSSSSFVKDIQENRNNPHEAAKHESYINNKGNLTEIRPTVSSHSESKPKMEYPSSYHSNMQHLSTIEKQESYQVRQSAPPLVKRQPEQFYPRENKIITVQDRQYMVLGVLGQGMSCEVVRAQDLSNSELRAIKCVNLSKMDKDSARGCLQEICMLDKLKAPCIVRMDSFQVKQPMVYVVMEIGDTDLSRLLKSMLQEKKQIPLTMILYYWTEMLTAVKHIHDHGVIHSDLKPANFLLVRGRLKLIDFGIASNINADMTSVVKNCPVGTLNYISPEALMDVSAGNTDSPNHNVKYKITYKSDVWSLGCILYGLVYGITPFYHIRQQWAKISAITDPKHNIKFPLTTGKESVPLILIDVMRKCLQWDPKARPSVAELLNIPYLQTNISPAVVPTISPTILLKIKNALSDEEWKKFTEVFENKQKQ